jgi:hypothetical protein
MADDGLTLLWTRSTQESTSTLDSISRESVINVVGYLLNGANRKIQANAYRSCILWVLVRLGGGKGIQSCDLSLVLVGMFICLKHKQSRIFLAAHKSSIYQEAPLFLLRYSNP